MTATVAGFDVEAVDYSQGDGFVRTRYDQAKISTSTAAIATLAEITGRDPAELTPLFSTIDPEALDALVRGPLATNGDLLVTFTHEGHEISVQSGGAITISLPESGPTASTQDPGTGA